MEVQINARKALQKKHHTILFSGNNLKSIESEDLTKDEKKYVYDFFKANVKRDLCFLNRYDYLIVIVRPSRSSGHQETEKFRQIGAKTWSYIKLAGAEKVQVKSLGDHVDILPAFIEGMALSSYEFIKYLTDTKDKTMLKEISVVGMKETDLHYISCVISATCKARDLGNEPVNHLSSEDLSEAISRLAKEAGFKFDFLNKKKIQSLKMGGLLAVNQASPYPPTFNILEYKSPKATNKKPVIFVGKGVTFDTGGVSIKPAAGMEKMKADMSGAAAVAAAIYGIAKAKLPVHVIGLIPSTDNRIGSHAIVPGDVITMYSGKTVEVINTDAEGRLILADALHYAKKYQPSLVIDLATLTGAAMMAVGEHGIVGMEKNADAAFQLLNHCSENVYERLVKFPLWEEYDDLIKSPVADLKNIGGPQAGAITAGKFLEHFTDYPWIHLDLSNAIIDRTNSYRTSGATGAGTRLLMEFARNLKDL